MKIDYEITVDVSNENVETKKKVEVAFSRLGFKLKFGRKNMPLKDIKSYTNSYGVVGLSKYLLFSDECFRPTHKIEELFKLAGMEKEMKPETNLKPFDLEKALDGEPVVTRDGREVTQATLFNCDSLYPLRAVVSGDVRAFTKDGVNNMLGISSDDLFMKQKTHIVNGFEVPAPITNPENMRDGVTYYVADATDPDWYFETTWANADMDIQWVERNLAFLSVDDAIANAKAMLGINPYEE